MNMELSSSRYYKPDPEAKKEHAIKIKDADWTKGLTVICFCGILFGLWGLGTGAHGFLKTWEGPDNSAIQRGQVSYDQIKLLHAAKKVEEQFRPLRLMLYAGKFTLSIALISGAGLLLMKLPFARQAMFWICGSAVLYHFLNAGLNCSMFVAMSGEIEEASRMSLYKYASNLKSVDGVVNQYMNGVAFGTLIGTFIGLLLKCGVYVRMMLFMNTPFVRAIYGEDPYPEYEEMMLATEVEQATEMA